MYLQLFRSPTTNFVSMDKGKGTAAPEDADRILWCFIRGDTQPFKVKAPIGIDIADLKDL
jgi:hypothetical protein